MVKKIRKYLFGAACIFVMALAITGSVHAAKGNCGSNMKWELDESTGELVISGSGAMDYYPLVCPWENYRGVIKTVIIKNGVESIQMYAFYKCSSLESVSIPNSVTEIGDVAFGSTSLKTIILPENITYLASEVFTSCEGLKSIVIPDNVTTISHHAFSKCKSLESITLPKNLERISNHAFAGCESIKSITIPDTVETLDISAFNGCSSLTAIIVGPGNNSFCDIDGVLFDKEKKTVFRCPEGREGLYRVPEGVTGMDSSAFEGCKKLTGIGLPSGLDTIGVFAFYGCSAIKNITIPYGVKEIRWYAFCDCSNLGSIYIPKSIKSFGEKMFSGCSMLKDIYYEGTEAEWNSIQGLQKALEGVNPTIHWAVQPSLTVDPVTATIETEQSLMISATGTPPIDASEEVTWTSSNPAVATVDANGLVTGIGAGSATITANVVDGRSASCTVTVNEKPRQEPQQESRIDFMTKALYMKIGSKRTLKPLLVNESIVSAVSNDKTKKKIISVKVAKSGKGITIKTGKKTGKTSITVTTASNKKKTLTVRVQKTKVITKTLKLSKYAVTLTKDKNTVEVTTTATPDKISTGETVKVSLTKADKKIIKATVDKATGKITIEAKKKGKAKVKVTCGKVTKNIKVTVK